MTTMHRLESMKTTDSGGNSMIISTHNDLRSRPAEPMMPMRASIPDPSPMTVIPMEAGQPFYQTDIGFADRLPSIDQRRRAFSYSRANSEPMVPPPAHPIRGKQRVQIGRATHRFPANSVVLAVIPPNAGRGGAAATAGNLALPPPEIPGDQRYRDKSIDESHRRRYNDTDGYYDDDDGGNDRRHDRPDRRRTDRRHRQRNDRTSYRYNSDSSSDGDHDRGRRHDRDRHHSPPIRHRSTTAVVPDEHDRPISPARYNRRQVAAIIEYMDQTKGPSQASLPPAYQPMVSPTTLPIVTPIIARLEPTFAAPITGFQALTPLPDTSAGFPVSSPPADPFTSVGKNLHHELTSHDPPLVSDTDSDPEVVLEKFMNRRKLQKNARKLDRK